MNEMLESTVRVPDFEVEMEKVKNMVRETLSRMSFVENECWDTTLYLDWQLPKEMISQTVDAMSRVLGET